MTGNMKLVANQDGTYDVIVQFNRADTEFALDFLSKTQVKNNYDHIVDFVRQKGKNLRVRNVRLMVGGLLIATISFFSLFNVSASEGGKFSMTYLYGGTPTQQIGYVERTGDAFDTVSPSYFDLDADGYLVVNPISQDLITRMHLSGTKVVPFLSNHWNRQAGVNALQNPEILSGKIAELVERHQLDGVNVDIENVTDAQRNLYSELVRLLRNKIPSNKEVSVAVAANPNGWTTGWHGSYDYTALAANSDYLMIMT